MQKIILKIISVGIISIFISGCAESIIESTESIDQQNNEDIAATFTDIQTNILDKSCGFSDCHGGAVSPNLSENSYANIVNKASSTGMNYITPNDPDNSYLLQKVMSSGNFQGSLMPISNPQLSQTQIDALIEWINAGAQNN